MEAADRMRVRTRSAIARSKSADPDRELRKLLRALQAVRDGDFPCGFPATRPASTARLQIPSTRS